MFKYTVALGVALLVIALLVLMMLPESILPVVTRCPPTGGFCTSTYNPIYPAAFIASLVGAILIFWGRTDRTFIFSSCFVAGMFLATLGWGAIVLGYLGQLSCIYGSYHQYSLGCMAYNPELFEPLILFAAAMISVNALSWYRAANSERQLMGRPRVRFFGFVSLFFGIIILLFGLTVVASFVGVSVSDVIMWVYWSQVALGVLLLLWGTRLLTLSGMTGEQKPTYS